MEIRFSRHAKRRAKLYAISETAITTILMNMSLSKGEHTIIENVAGFKYPLKIVVSVEEDIITVVTSYPLKKGKTK